MYDLLGLLYGEVIGSRGSIAVRYLIVIYNALHNSRRATLADALHRRRRRQRLPVRARIRITAIDLTQHLCITPPRLG